MDEATKAGYGVLLMRQALPKSQFYARTTATIRAGLQEPAPGPADTLPFGVLGRGPTRKPLDLAKDAHVAALAVEAMDCEDSAQRIMSSVHALRIPSDAQLKSTLAQVMLHLPTQVQAQAIQS